MAKKKATAACHSIRDRTGKFAPSTSASPAAKKVAARAATKNAAATAKKKAATMGKMKVAAAAKKEAAPAKKKKEAAPAKKKKEAAGKKPMEEVLVICHGCYEGRAMCHNWLHHGKRCLPATPMPSSFIPEPSSKCDRVRAKNVLYEALEHTIAKPIHKNLSNLGSKLDGFGEQLGNVVKSLDKVMQKLDSMAPKPK